MGIWGAVRRRRGWIAAALAGIFVVSWPPVAWLAVQPLEHGYPASPPSVDDVEAIVVLSSAVLPAGVGRPGAIVASDTYERCAYAAWLYQHRKSVPVLVSGGSSPEVPEPAALPMRKELVAFGLPESMVWIEDRSRSTYENAFYSAEILRQKGVGRILLVTEAYHMVRSERCFRKLGLSVIPAPCGAHELLPVVSTFIPDGGAILDNEHALHEYIGLGWYGIKGRI